MSIDSLRGRRTKGGRGELNSRAKYEESAKRDRWDLALRDLLALLARI